MKNTPYVMRIRRPDDFHVHLRDGSVLKRVLPATAKSFARALVMPNLTPPIETAEQAMAYRERILSVEPNFTPLMTIYLTERTTPDVINAAARAGVIAAKYYPKAGTTNADHGLEPEQLLKMRKVLRAMQRNHMVLCLHGERLYSRNGDMLPRSEREEAFLPTLVKLAKRHSDLKMVLEHVTTTAAVDCVRDLPNVAATITAHHLLLTERDVESGDPDCLCMPVAKSEADRKALIVAAVGGERCFFFGSDTAPHSRSAKHRKEPAYGIYSAPVALPVLAELFRRRERIKYLEDFVSRFGAEWYELLPNEDFIELIQEPKLLKDPTLESDDASLIRPFLAGMEIPWRLAGDDNEKEEKNDD